MWQGVVIGTSISFVTALATWVVFRWALARGPAMFTRVFIAGISGRLLVVGTAALLVLGLTDVHRQGFGAGLVATYLLLLVAEVVYLLRRGRRLAAASPGGGATAVDRSPGTTATALDASPGGTATAVDTPPGAP